MNLFGAALAIGRRFFLKNTGRKLSHLDKQFNVSHADLPVPVERGGFQLVSRDAFSHDPQDTLDVRDTSTRRSVRQHRSSLPDTRDGRNSAPGAPGRAR